MSSRYEPEYEYKWNQEQEQDHSDRLLLAYHDRHFKALTFKFIVRIFIVILFTVFGSLALPIGGWGKAAIIALTLPIYGLMELADAVEKL